MTRDNERPFAWSPDDEGSTITEALAYAIYEQDDKCEGHQSLAGDSMGSAVYCDGSCVTFDAWVAAVLDTEGVPA